MAKKVKRLLGEFQPLHYIIDLKPDRTKLRFAGSVIVTGKKIGRPSRRITLHQNGLNIHSAHITFNGKSGDKEIPVTRINKQQSLNELRLHVAEPISPGEYTISLEFSGKISRQMEGIYPCQFEHGGKSKKLVATQFESHFARQVFPCIDEPSAKATFDLTLTTPAKETVIANTPVASEVKNGRFKTTTFETTPRMSTYLLAFIYGELDYLEARTKKGTLVRTYATPDNTKHTQFALDTAVKCMEFYEGYFDIDFPLPKCDLTALPDFAAAGMENWGCITFSELALMVDEKNTSLSAKQLVAMVVSHELAHMWFGNLVTMHWWTDLWLNEGFASWVEYLALVNIFPEWKMWTQFIVDEQQPSLKYDALENTRAVEVPAINHPAEIRTAFDPPISYGKGSSVIHMLYNYLGKESFKAGLRYYLKKHAFGNTKTDDLWEALQEASEKPVKDFMQHWISQPGFPLVRATVEAKRVTITQERFFVNPAHKKISRQTWPVVLLAENSQIPEIFNKSDVKITTASTQTLKLNLGQSGFYRTVYNSSHLEHLGEQVKRGRLSVEDRLGLLADLVEGAKAGYIDTVDVLHFFENFANEDSYVVWEVISGFIGSLRLVMNDEQLREDIKPFVRKLVALQVKRLGWERKPKDSHFDRLLRPVVLGLAASADEPTTLALCKKTFAHIKHTDELRSDLQAIPLRRSVKRGGEVDPDLRGIVFGTVARLGGAPEFNKLLRLYREATLSEEKLTLAAALTSFRQPVLIKRALAMINSEDVRLQDVAHWIAYSFLNRHGKTQAWQWLKSNWSWLSDNLGGDLSFFFTPVYSARVFSDTAFLKDYRAFFKSVMQPGLERTFERGVEMIQWQAAWKKRALGEVQTFLGTYTTSKTGKNSPTR